MRKLKYYLNKQLCKSIIRLYQLDPKVYTNLSLALGYILELYG